MTWSKETRKTFTAYDVKLKYKWWGSPHFKMAGKGCLSVTCGGGRLLLQPKRVKYFWQMYKKE